MKRIIEIFKKTHKILILGFGREGKSTYIFIRENFPKKHIAIADRNESLVKTNHFLSTDNYTEIKTGSNYLADLGQHDLIMKSPGVKIPDVLLKKVTNKISSQTDIFLKHYSGQTIGITGTKGKSTTSALIHHILTNSGIHSILAGNIGTPCFHILSKINPDTRIVMELSAHQLESITTSPHIAIILNLFNEHLDYFSDQKKYYNAKLNIARYQQNADYFIHEYENQQISKFIASGNIISKQISFSTRKPSANIFIKDGHIFKSGSDISCGEINLEESTGLKGQHNLKNILAAISCCTILKIPINNIVNQVKTFSGLEHRLEYVGKYGGIHFYDDSISTIPESTIEALKSISNADILILGGFDRGLSYLKLVKYISKSKLSTIICYGQAGSRIYQVLKENTLGNIEVFLIDEFSEIKEVIASHAINNSICLLSPAAASYDQFNSFEERGQLYNKIARSF